MAPRTLTAEAVLAARAETGEGPIWDERGERLLWVDIPSGAVHRLDPLTGSDTAADAGQPVGAVGLRERGGLVLALRDGFAVSTADGANGDLDVEIVAPTEADRPGNRMNDGRVDPRGRFWAGTMAFDLSRGAGSLYRLDPDRGVRTMLTGLGISNGLDWTADASRMYFVDSFAGGIDVFDFDADSGDIADRRRFVDVAESVGLPDGLCVDAEDHVWLAIWGAGAVHRYAPDGMLDTIVRVPAAQVTSCAFGGPDLADLYITSAAAGLSEEALREQPHSGALFRCRPGARGRLPHRFAG